jgi:hypothetical protein
MSGPLIAVPEFGGEPEGSIQSTDFLKKFRRFMTYLHITDDERMVESFGDHLKSGSQAEEWFKEQDASKKTFKVVEAAFLEHFPPVEKAKKTETEWERELCELRLKVEELGKMEKYQGEDVWSHVAFAEKVLNLAKQAKINTGSNSIWKVRDELPEIIRQKVKETYANWSEFCGAIKGVEMSHIRDGVRKYQKEKDEKEKVEAAIAGLHRLQQQQQRRPPPPHVPLSPTSIASNAMQSMTIRNTRSGPATTTNTTQPTAAANTNPFANPAGGQGNLFRQPLPPVTSADRDALQQSLTYFPMQPNTPEGNRVWMDQIREWRVKHGEGPVTVATGFPLRPGGAPPGSGECYRCGYKGHRRDSGLCATEPINPRERTFRTICGRVLLSAPTAQVNLVDDVESEFGWLGDHTLVSTSSQGNGEGLPA